MIRKGYTLETDLMPIMKGDVPLPNPEPIEGDLASTILYYNSMQSGRCVLLPGETNKKWNVSFFLDHGQGGQLEGSGVVAWTTWDNEKRAPGATGLRFAICKHTKVEGAGANHSRGWHPGHCSKCGLDMTVDSGD
jgi:hypothetical protein